MKKKVKISLELFSQRVRFPGIKKPVFFIHLRDLTFLLHHYTPLTLDTTSTSYKNWDLRITETKGKYGSEEFLIKPARHGFLYSTDVLSLDRSVEKFTNDYQGENFISLIDKSHNLPIDFVTYVCPDCEDEGWVWIGRHQSDCSKCKGKVMNEIQKLPNTFLSVLSLIKKIEEKIFSDLTNPILK